MDSNTAANAVMNRDVHEGLDRLHGGLRRLTVFRAFLNQLQLPYNHAAYHALTRHIRDMASLINMPPADHPMDGAIREAARYVQNHDDTDSEILDTIISLYTEWVETWNKPANSTTPSPSSYAATPTTATTAPPATPRPEATTPRPEATTPRPEATTPRPEATTRPEATPLHQRSGSPKLRHPSGSKQAPTVKSLNKKGKGRGQSDSDKGSADEGSDGSDDSNSGHRAGFHLYCKDVRKGKYGHEARIMGKKFANKLKSVSKMHDGPNHEKFVESAEALSKTPRYQDKAFTEHFGELEVNHYIKDECRKRDAKFRKRASRQKKKATAAAPPSAATTTEAPASVEAPAVVTTTADAATAPGAAAGLLPAPHARTTVPAALQALQLSSAPLAAADAAQAIATGAPRGRVIDASTLMKALENATAAVSMSKTQKKDFMAAIKQLREGFGEADDPQTVYGPAPINEPAAALPGDAAGDPFPELLPVPEPAAAEGAVEVPEAAVKRGRGTKRTATVVQAEEVTTTSTADDGDVTEEGRPKRARKEAQKVKENKENN